MKTYISIKLAFSFFTRIQADIPERIQTYILCSDIWFHKENLL